MRPDPPLPPLFDRATARAAGLTDRQIDHRLATGAWKAERRGQLRPVAGPDLPYDVLAAVRRIGAASTVVSHGSAARWWGLPRPLGGWGEVHLTSGTGSSRHRDGVRLHVAALPEADVVLRADVAVTSVARTVVDCLRTLPPADALAIADAAVHRRLVTPSLLTTMVEAHRGRPGAIQARALLTLVDGRRESPLESWSAWAFDRERVPRPVWQQDLFDLGRCFVGRVDAWWQPGLIGEADGRLKYRLAAAERGGATPEVLEDVVADERRRQRRLEDLGAEILRWGARDVLAEGPRRDLALHVQERLLSASRHRTWRGRLM